MQALLTASLQNYARSHRIPVDTLGFTVEVTKGRQIDPGESSPGCCYIDGLHLEGARYDFYCLGFLFELSQNHLIGDAAGVGRHLRTFTALETGH